MNPKKRRHPGGGAKGKSIRKKTGGKGLPLKNYRLDPSNSDGPPAAEVKPLKNLLKPTNMVAGL